MEAEYLAALSLLSPFLMLKLVFFGQGVGCGTGQADVKWMEVGTSWDLQDEQEPASVLLLLTMMSTVSYRSWTFHHEANTQLAQSLKKLKEAPGKLNC